jgi:hypothetical protein
MCTHKYRLTVQDKRFLARLQVTIYDCAECERVKLLPPPKIRLEEEDGA